MTQIMKRCAPNGQPRSGNTAGNRIQLPLQQYPNGRIVFGTGAAFVPRSGSASWMCLWYSEDGGETCVIPSSWASVILTIAIYSYIDIYSYNCHLLLHCHLFLQLPSILTIAIYSYNCHLLLQLPSTLTLTSILTIDVYSYN